MLLASNLLRLEVNVIEANNYKTRKLYKKPYKYILLLIMSHQATNFEGEGKWPRDFWKVLKVEHTLNIEMTSLSVIA